MPIRNGHDRVCRAWNGSGVGTQGRIVAKDVIGALPPVEQWIALQPSDTVDLARGELPDRDAVHDDQGSVLNLATAPEMPSALQRIAELTAGGST
jgi:hypothetical protein